MLLASDYFGLLASPHSSIEPFDQEIPSADFDPSIGQADFVASKSQLDYLTALLPQVGFPTVVFVPHVT